MKLSTLWASDEHEARRQIEIIEEGGAIDPEKRGCRTKQGG